MLSLWWAWKHNIHPLNHEKRNWKYLNNNSPVSSLFVNPINESIRGLILSSTIFIETITLKIMNSIRVKLYPSIKCCFLQLHRHINEEVSDLHHYYTYAGTILITCIMLILCLHNIMQNNWTKKWWYFLCNWSHRHNWNYILYSTYTIQYSWRVRAWGRQIPEWV